MRTNAQGQALILVVLALLVLCFGLIVVFDTGQVVSKKVQLVNTADAAVYSAAIQEARALNLIAYMNRASVANEVAMAQMVSWYSWTNFAISATDHLKIGLQILEAVTLEFGGEVLQPVVNALQEAKAGLEEGRDFAQKLFDTAAMAVAGLNGVYSKTSLAIADGMAVDTPYVAREVVHLNDPQADITPFGWGVLIKGAGDASGYVVRHRIADKGKARDQGSERLKNVVMEARDPFSRQRDGSTLYGWIRKYGGTDMVNYDSWVGLDTLNLDFTVGAPPLGDEYDIALAWGGGASVDKDAASFASLAKQNAGWSGPYQGYNPQYATRQRFAPFSNALGNGQASDYVLWQPAEGGTPWIKPSLGRLGGTVGLSDYSDIDANKALLPYDNGKSATVNGVSALDVGPKFTVLVAHPPETLQTSSHISGIGGPPDFQTKDKTVSGGITAMASAEVYFSRPRNLFPRLTEAGRETGSLFSPYWQARLIDTPADIRLEVGASQSLASP
jgi:hypothetical protein